MPTINKRFLLKLLVVSGLLTGVLFGVHFVQARRIPDALLRQADRAADDGKTDTAIRYLRQYLEFRPDDVDAMERLATLMRQRDPGDVRSLILIYDKILRADPNRHAVRREAVGACLRMGRFSDTEAHASILLKEYPNDADLWQKRASAAAGLQRPADVLAGYEAAIAANPTDSVSYQRLAQYLWKEQHQTEAAKKVVERMVAALPQSGESYLTRARFDIYAGDGAGAFADLKKAAELDPKHVEVRLLLAEQYQKQRNLVAAIDLLSEGMRQHPDEARFVRSLAWIELNRGNFGAAVLALEEGLGKVKDPMELLVPLADLLVQMGEIARTEAIVKKLENRTSESARLQSKYLKARLAMRAGEWATAGDYLGQLRTESAKLPVLEQQANLLLSVCYQRQGEIAQEQDTLKLILNKDPNHNAARVALAQSYLNAGRTTEAMKEYQTAVQSPSAAPQTHASLLRLKAREYRANPKVADWPQLDRIAGELAKAYPPSSIDPLLVRAELMEARGDRAQAIAALRAEVSRRPGDARLWAALAEKVAALVGTAAGLGVLDEGQASAGDGPDLRLARADLSARDPARLRPIRPLAEGIDTWSDADQIKLFYGMIEIFDRLGEHGEAVRIYQKLAVRRPADVAVWELLCERATRAGDAAVVQVARTTLATLEPSGKSSSLTNAWIAIAGKQPEPARAAAAELAKQFGPSPVRADVCTALARLKVLTGETVEAGKMFERAVRLEPLRFPPMQAYLAFLSRIGADDAIAFQLNRLNRDHRWAGEPFRRAVSGAAVELTPDQAKQLLGKARPFVEREPGGLGWLGENYSRCNCSPESVEAFATAIEKPTSTADDWLRLALRTTAGAKALDAAAAKLAPAYFYPVAAAFAESSVAPKNWEPAFAGAPERKAFAQSRLALKLSQFQRSESIALLDKFLAAQPPAADAAWARRNQAMLLAVRGGSGDRERAMQLVLTGTDTAGDTSEDKRSTAAVLTLLSRFVDGPDRKIVLERATRVMKELVAESHSPRDEFLLVQLYRAAGERAASAATLQRLIQSDPKNLEYHLAMLDECSEAGSFEAGETQAQRLLNDFPSDFRALAAVARFECQAGRAEKALEIANGYLRTADPQAGDLPLKAARVAELLHELARKAGVRKTPTAKAMIAAAIERYETVVPTSPETLVPLVGLIALDGRSADAFARIEKASTIPESLRLAAGLAILRVGGASPRQFEIVKGWLDRTGSAEPDSIAFRLNEGEFFSLKQDYANAEKAYESVLNRDPRNVVALNNLAWILAPRPESAARALAFVDRAVGEIGLTGELLDTRARVRIAAKQFDLAEKDLVEALTQDKTALRMFHLALAKQGQTPPKLDEAREAFRKAKDRGLESKSVHPADLPIYRAFEAGVN